MSIIFITIPGQQKIDFANELHLKTGNQVSLVIVQKTRNVKWQEKYQNLVQTVGLGGLLSELYYSMILRMSSKYRNYIKYFFNRTDNNSKAKFLPKVIEFDNINSDEVYKILQENKPELLVVWGTNILKSRIFESAKNAINLHMGIGEYYRGSVANHFAVLEDKRERIGAMIHKIDKNTDSGDVYKVIKANLNLPPKELFTDLNDQAYKDFLDISFKLWKGEKLTPVPQNLENGKNVFLRQWTPQRRIIVAKKLYAWEQEFFSKINKKENSILQNTFLIAIFVVFAQVLGLIRDLYLVKIFGIGEILDTYLLAFKIPDMMNVFYSIFLGSVIFIPLLTKAKKDSENMGEEGKLGIIREVNKVGSLVLILVTSVACLLYLFMPILANILAPHWQGQQLENLISMSRLLLIAQFFFPIGILGGVIGMVYGKPLGMAISGTIYNIFILLGAIFLTPLFGIYGVIYGVITGSIFFAAVQIFPKKVRNILSDFKFRIFILEWKTFFIKNIGRFFSVLLNQTYLILMLVLASFAGSGGVTIFNNAFHLYLSMFFILGASYSTALMPQNALLNINGEHAELKNNLEKSLIYMSNISLFLATFAFVFSFDIISILFQFSDLTLSQTESIALIFAILILSVPLLNTIEILRKYMYATGLISYSVFVMGSFLFFLVLFNYILQNLNMPILVSLAYATFIANFLTVILILGLLHRIEKLEIQTVLRNVYKTIIIAILSASIYIAFIDNFIFVNTNYLAQLLLNFASLFAIYILSVYIFKDKISTNILQNIYYFVSKKLF